MITNEELIRLAPDFSTKANIERFIKTHDLMVLLTIIATCEYYINDKTYDKLSEALYQYLDDHKVRLVGCFDDEE